MAFSEHVFFDRHSQVYLICPVVGHLILADVKITGLPQAARTLDEIVGREATVTERLGWVFVLEALRRSNWDTSERSHFQTIIKHEGFFPP